MAGMLSQVDLYKYAFQLMGTENDISQIAKRLTEYSGILIRIVDIGNWEVCETFESESDKKKIVTNDCISEAVDLCLRGGEIHRSGEVLDAKGNIWKWTTGTIEMDGEPIGCSMALCPFEGPSDLTETICQLVNDSANTLIKNGRLQIQSARTKLQLKIAGAIFENEADEELTTTEWALLQEHLYGKMQEIILVSQQAYPFNWVPLEERVRAIHEQAFFYSTGNREGILVYGNQPEAVYGLLQKEIEAFARDNKLWMCSSACFREQSLLLNHRRILDKTIQIAEKLSSEPQVLEEYEHYLPVSCSIGAVGVGKAGFMDAELREMKHQDEEKGTEFYCTLKEYLNQQNNVTATAKQLFIHRNTMFYRITRIGEILGVDIGDGAIARKLMVTIALQECE